MIQQPKWDAVVKHCEEELQRLHHLLEGIQPEATTNQLRGEIRAVRRVLKLAEHGIPADPRKLVQPETPPY